MLYIVCLFYVYTVPELSPHSKGEGGERHPIGLIDFVTLHCARFCCFLCIIASPPPPWWCIYIHYPSPQVCASQLVSTFIQVLLITEHFVVFALELCSDV